MNLRFLLDEHINKAIQRQLRRIDTHIDVLVIGDFGASSSGTLDPEILNRLEERGYILVTENLMALGRDGRRRIRHARVRGQVIEFLVQYEIYLEGQWYPVVRYDTSHGFAHKDIP